MIDNKEYDAIISLGHNCQVASQLRRNHLRKFSGPLDWFNFAKTSEVCKVLQNRFEGFMLLENLEVYGKSQNCHYVRDKSTTCLSFHDFKNVTEEDPLFDYFIFRETLDRRIRRFIDCLSSNKDILLIRANVNSTDSFDIYHAIKETYSNPNVHFLFVNQSDEQQIIEQPSTFKSINSLQIPSGKTWEGNYEAWKKVLSRFSLRR
ncbi:DUF1796 family putative cysteine peptidase [Paenibacillus pini]|uniref:Papain-like cysteine peptidase n=1 Tax=Paenibacillus pini JCM 16418 TaxID=1236976 RepID=W7YP30_9BACL|nr:DUF1796 family putative cysteine peptidase [Paenibacillus pini]GAF06431.1 hypothetical protein JCM16418_386 [Paenibacillus pini JCM 16418]